jgi:hypothetical protein
VNGTVATVSAVGRHGLDVHTDDGTAMSIPLEFVQGTRADGTPNLSHAWARTVDGAQGGTWDHAHLLGSAALDGYRGYTGQSRSRHPTHTWNTTPLDDGDHGGRLADLRSAQQRVAAALARIPDVTIAAVDDPWPTDRRLGAIIDAHHAILDRQPPDRMRELADARQALADAQGQLAATERREADTRADIDNLGPIRSLSRAGRAERRQLEGRLSGEQRAVIDAAGAVARAEHRVERLERDQEAHDQFERTEGWRRHAIVAAEDKLDGHWTAVAVDCCRAEQPLAYGVEPLRLAHRRLTGQLANLDASLPADREAERRTARTRLVEAVTDRRAAERELVDATRQHERLSTQRWPRRDSDAIGRAADRVQHAHEHLDCAYQTEEASRARLGGLNAHQQERRRALNATAPERRELATALTVIDDALEGSQSERVMALLDRRAAWHNELLGPVPPTSAGRAVWCDAAHRLESHLDRYGHGGHGWTDLSHDLAQTLELCVVADSYPRTRRPRNPPPPLGLLRRAGAGGP